MRMRPRISLTPQRHRHPKEGFTLLELLVVLILLAVIATAGVAVFTKTVEHARAETVINDLRAIRARETARRSVTGQYVNGTLVGAAQINPAPANTSLTLRLADGDYVCTLIGDGATFTATANPSAARTYAGTITLNQAGVWGGASPFVPDATRGE